MERRPATTPRKRRRNLSYKPPFKPTCPELHQELHAECTNEERERDKYDTP